MKCTLKVSIFILFIISCKKDDDFCYFNPLTNGYQMVWGDEFDGYVLDTLKWSYRALGQRSMATNIKEATFLNGEGKLCITLSNKDGKYYAGMIGSQGKFESLYGYYECRVKMNKCIGPHSAFWLQSPLIHQEGSPGEVGTEVDIFEYMPLNPEWVIHNLYWGYKEPVIKNVSKSVQIPQIANGYHTFGVEWDAYGYTFYVDGMETFHTDSAISGVPLYVIASAEITGKWGDVLLDDSDTVFFDYIRVYSKVMLNDHE